MVESRLLGAVYVCFLLVLTYASSVKAGSVNVALDGDARASSWIGPLDPGLMTKYFSNFR